MFEELKDKIIKKQQMLINIIQVVEEVIVIDIKRKLLIYVNFLKITEN